MKPIFGSRAPETAVIDSPETLAEFERRMSLRVPWQRETAEELAATRAAMVAGIWEWAEERERNAIEK